MIIATNKETGVKHCNSPDYNYRFDPRNGEFIRWGKTLDDDPECGPLEILDIEIGTACHGIGKGPCSFCYKGNIPRGENMSFETFKHIFDLVTKEKTLTQLAAGIGDLWGNPDMLKMFEYSRQNGVVPNVTTNGYKLTDQWAKDLAKVCGGVAVSRYEPKDVCYDAVEKLVRAGVTQTNIHMLFSQETYDQCIEVIDDATTDPRLSGLKAIVFLTLKPKGKRNKHSTIKDVGMYRDLINYAFSKNVSVGFDSCSAPIFLTAMKEHPQFEQFSQMAESCESDRFSGYINVKGEFWHCSFTEGQPGWKGIDMMKVEDFHRDVWMSDEVKRFRHNLTCQDNSHISHDCKLCPVYSLYDDDAIGNAPNLKKVIPITQVTHT